MTQPLKIAVAGLGTVGAGVVKLLASQSSLLEARCGKRLAVTAVSARDRGKKRGIDLGGVKWFDDPVEMARSADADVVVELIGGADGPAKAMAEAAIARGRHIVTANKALLAHHGTAIAAAASSEVRSSRRPSFSMSGANIGITARESSAACGGLRA